MLPRLDPPPPNLLVECAEGIAPPEGRDVTLAELADVVKDRERAAAVCRERHARLASWARSLSLSTKD